MPQEAIRFSFLFLLINLDVENVKIVEENITENYLLNLGNI